MKKLMAILTAAAAMCSVVPFAASAEEVNEKNYIPTVYFKAQTSENGIVLPQGVVYFNTKAANPKTSAEVYIKDDFKRIGQMFIKWTYPDGIKLSNIQDPISAGKLSPYKAFTKPEDFGINNTPDRNLMGISYTDTNTDPIALSAEKSDSFPIAYFDIAVDASAAADYYDIAFKTEQPDVANIAYRPSDGSIRDIRPSGENAPSLTLAVTDRALGDVNADNKIDAMDASSVLTDYTLRSANKDGILSKEGLIAADVNGNRKVDAMDASTILSYYAYSSKKESLHQEIRRCSL